MIEDDLKVPENRYVYSPERNMSSWRLWPVWMSSEAAERIEDKVDELRRDIKELKEKIAHIDRVIGELEGPKR